MGVTSLKFQNFKVFRDAELPLSRITLIIGPNGTGKSTTLEALKCLSLARQMKAVMAPQNSFPRANAIRSLGTPLDDAPRLDVLWDDHTSNSLIWNPQLSPHPASVMGDGTKWQLLSQARIFSFQHIEIAAPVPLTKTLTIDEGGRGAAAVLTNLQDQFPERFDSLNGELTRWLPEFDRVLLDTPTQGQRSFMLRTRHGGHKIAAANLSQGTLFAVALLTVCHLPDPPSIIGLEDPDRGMHPRLLRDVLDALNRLTDPEAAMDKRPTVQAIVTTHSPYFVDLFRDRPEDVFLLEKRELWSTFQRLSDVSNIHDILQDAHLGEAWFSGSLGGVPAHT